MSPIHRIFCAIPFDAATRHLYETVGGRLRAQFPEVTVVIGTEQLGPSKPYLDITAFKRQNMQLTERIVNEIERADIVVADLTHNNPNVHVELGIALVQNKNILRVTGRSLSELGFDIRNLEMHSYQDAEGLFKSVIEYYETFVKIKRLSIASEHGDLYWNAPTAITLKSSERRPHLVPIRRPGLKIRDGAIRVSFTIQEVNDEDNWFGIYFRAGENPFLGSCLLYVRPNGMIEIAIYPGPDVVTRFDTGQPLQGPRDLIAEFENNRIEIRLNGGQRLSSFELSYQAPGRISLAAWNSSVNVMSAEMICRDTIEWPTTPSLLG